MNIAVSHHHYSQRAGHNVLEEFCNQARHGTTCPPPSSFFLLPRLPNLSVEARLRLQDPNQSGSHAQPSQKSKYKSPFKWIRACRCDRLLCIIVGFLRRQGRVPEWQRFGATAIRAGAAEGKGKDGLRSITPHLAWQTVSWGEPDYILTLFTITAHLCCGFLKI